jgi:hypothetical protein
VPTLFEGIGRVGINRDYSGELSAESFLSNKFPQHFPLVEKARASCPVKAVAFHFHVPRGGVGQVLLDV